MKNDQFTTGRNNQEAPQPGMAATDTNNFDELENKSGAQRDEMPASPKATDSEGQEKQQQHSES